MGSDVFDRFCLGLGRGVVVAGFLLVPIALAEGVTRFLHDPVPIRRVYDPFAHRIPQPLLVDTFETLDGERVTVRLNELGMRGPRLAEAMSEAMTLVFLGGSTTENYAYPREETFPELVGERLQSQLDRPVRVFNAGMSAGTTSTSFSRLQHQVLDLDPALIVVMHGINDLVFGFHPGFRRDGRHLHRPPAAGQRPRSFLLDWFRERWSRRAARRPAAVGQERRVDAFADFPALGVFARNLESMAAVATAHRVPILFLTQATRYSSRPTADEAESFRIVSAVRSAGAVPPDIPSLAKGMQAFNAAVLALPAGPCARVFDLAARIPRDEALIFDECHFTRTGNQRVAEVLGPVVESIVTECSLATPH